MIPLASHYRPIDRNHNSYYPAPDLHPVSIASPRYVHPSVVHRPSAFKACLH